jgi:hypothetical protein
MKIAAGQSMTSADGEHWDDCAASGDAGFPFDEGDLNDATSGNVCTVAYTSDPDSIASTVDINKGAKVYSTTPMVPYTGKPQTPTVEVDFDGVTLSPKAVPATNTTPAQPQDYTVSYSNNTNPGLGKITITGVGQYSGSFTATFTILHKTLNKADFIFDKTHVYNKLPQSANVKLKDGISTESVGKWTVYYGPRGEDNKPHSPYNDQTATPGQVEADDTPAYLTTTPPTDVGTYEVYVKTDGGTLYDALPLTDLGTYTITGGGGTDTPTVPTIGGGVNTASVKTPAAVTMGGAGSSYSTANDGQGVCLSLTTPVVTSDGGATVTQKGWLISKSASKPATSTLGARSYSTSSWQSFNPSTYMTLGDNGKYLVYYARNSVGYGYSNEVKITVKSSYPYPEVGGSSRIATSALTALDAWSTGVSKAVFCSGSDFYDADSASYLAGALDCPILLLSGTSSNNSPVKSAIKSLGIKSAYVVGGACTASMMKSVGISSYKRVSSAKDAPDVSSQVVSYVVKNKLASKPTSAILTTSSGFADALGAASYVANPALNMPLLFTKGANDSKVATSVAKSVGGFKSLYVLGSTSSVSAAAAKKVRSSYTRLWGSDRNQTAAAVFTYFSPKVAAANSSKHIDSIGIAAASNYPDALGAGAAEAHLGGVVLITPPATVGTLISKELRGGTYTVSGSKRACKDASLVKTLTNFEFYGWTISLKVRQAISKYVR